MSEAFVTLLAAFFFIGLILGASIGYVKGLYTQILQHEDIDDDLVFECGCVHTMFKGITFCEECSNHLYDDEGMLK